MRLQYASDLHLEFPENRLFLKDQPLEPAGDILLLAGDILPFGLIGKHADFFNYLADHFEHTYWLPGNHEYYHTDAAQRSGTFCEAIRGNVSLVNDWSVTHGDVQLIFTTLWSKLSEANWWEIHGQMNDFRLIKYDGYPLSFDHYNQLHQAALTYVDTALNTPTELRKVVVSHHVPTYLEYPQQYKGSVLSEAFAVELFPLIEKTQPACWIYGHHHVNTPEFRICETRLLTNQLGYVKYQEHVNFQNNKLIFAQ